MKIDQNDERATQLKIGQIAGAVLNPGGFYLSPRIGGFQDVRSGLKFPGPKAIVDPVTHEIIEFTDLPLPIQLPTHRYAEFNSLGAPDQHKVKRVRVRLSNEADLVLCRFDSYTNDDFLGGLLLALRTETIQHITDDEMQVTFPEVWAARKSEIIHASEMSVTTASMFDTLLNARKVRLATKDEKVK